MGHFTVVASSIHMHTVLCEKETWRAKEALRRLEKNVKHLEELQKYWPILNTCVSRMWTLIQPWQTSPFLEPWQTNYRMDRWMVRFLTEFARPLAANERIERMAAAWGVGS